jgi:hypothetical protein
MDYTQRQQALQARLKELIQTYQQTQATLNGLQSEICEVQGRLKESQFYAEESRRVHDGNRPGGEGGPSIDPARFLERGGPVPPS